MAILDMFTPKGIILDAIRKHLEGTGINKIILCFNVITDKYNVAVSKADGGSMHLNIEQDDITKLKKLFVNRIYTLYKKRNKKEIKAIIIEIDMDENTVNVFTQDLKDEVEMFNY